MNREAAEAPMDSIQLASKTDVGRVRSANEDSCDTFSRDDGTRLLVVADGMGGHRGGATASQTAVETIAETFSRERSARPGAMLAEAIEAANARVFEMAQQDPELEGMGTTVVAFLLGPRLEGTVAHVGDSRAYRYRRGRLEPITVDHSVVAEMQRRGLISADEAAVHPRRNEILRSVGVLPVVEVEVAEVEVSPGDRFVLCSDGLSGVVSDDEIARIVQSESPEQAVESLIAMANEAGGPDNISVQVLAIPADESEGDPEATAPVEVSAVGIEAIEARRRARRRTQRIVSVAVLVAGILAAWLALRTLGLVGGGGGTVEAPRATPEPADAADAPSGAAPPPDRFEAPREGARRGVPSGAERNDLLEGR